MSSNSRSKEEKKVLKSENKIQYLMEYSFSVPSDDDYDYDVDSIYDANDEELYDANGEEPQILKPSSPDQSQQEAVKQQTAVEDNKTANAPAEPKQNSEAKESATKKDDTKNTEKEAKPQDKKPVIRSWWKKPDSVLL